MRDGRYSASGCAFDEAGEPAEDEEDDDEFMDDEDAEDGNCEDDWMRMRPWIMITTPVHIIAHHRHDITTTIQRQDTLMSLPLRKRNCD